MKNLSDLYTGLLIGLILGNLMGLMAPPNLLRDLIRKPQYKVGECFSNGLFAERVVEVRDRNYITQSNLSGKWKNLPSSTNIRTVDEIYVRVDCETWEMMK